MTDETEEGGAVGGATDAGAEAGPDIELHVNNGDPLDPEPEDEE